MAKKSSISVLPDLPEWVDTAVCNITNPITCNVGNTLGDLWYLVFGGIHQAAEKKRLKIAANLEQFKDELEAGVNAIPEERKVEPKLQIVGPALESAKYCIEEPALRAMFARLISRSMDSSYTQKVHPSFTNMISQMTPVDAEILKNLFLFSSSQNDIDIIKLTFQTLSGDHRTIYANRILDQIKRFNSYEKSISINSLARLGIIYLEFLPFSIADAIEDGLELPSSRNLAEISHYQNLLISKPQEVFPNKNNKIINSCAIRGKLCFTEIGNMFSSTCI